MSFHSITISISSSYSIIKQPRTEQSEIYFRSRLVFRSVNTFRNTVDTHTQNSGSDFPVPRATCVSVTDTSYCVVSRRTRGQRTKCPSLNVMKYNVEFKITCRRHTYLHEGKNKSIKTKRIMTNLPGTHSCCLFLINSSYSGDKNLDLKNLNTD
jgi:hypothetical protein